MQIDKQDRLIEHRKSTILNAGTDLGNYVPPEEDTGNEKDLWSRDPFDNENDTRRHLNDLIKKEKESNWGQIFCINLFLSKLCEGMLISTLWLFIFMNPEQNYGTHAEKLPVYKWAVIGYFVFKFIAYRIGDRFNGKSQRPKLIMIMSLVFFAFSSSFLILYAAKKKQGIQTVEELDHADLSQSTTEQKWYYKYYGSVLTQYNNELLVSILCAMFMLALFFGIQEQVHEQYIYDIIEPTMRQVTNAELELVTLLGLLIGSIISFIINQSTDFDEIFLIDAEFIHNGVNKSKALYYFMTKVAFTQASFQFIQIIHCFVRFNPLDVQQREFYALLKKHDVRSQQIEKLEEIMRDNYSKVALATANDLQRLKENNPPDLESFISTLLQRSVFDMSLGMLAMTVCGNLYSCFDYFSLHVNQKGQKKYMLSGLSAFVQWQVISSFLVLGISGVVYQQVVLKHFRENRRTVVNIAYLIQLCACTMLVISNEERHLAIMFISTMFMTFGAYLGHLTCSNTICMLLGTEQTKPNYKFKHYIQAAQIQSFLAFLLGVEYSGDLLIHYTQLDLTEQEIYPKLEQLMTITYGLIAFFIILSVTVTSFMGIGISNQFHCSFEIILQERIMRYQLYDKFKKQWQAAPGSKEDHQRIMNEWILEKNYVPEEYRTYTSYSDKRKEMGAQGKKVTKIRKAPEPGQLMSEAMSSEKSNYLDTLDSFDLLEDIPTNDTPEEALQKKTLFEQEKMAMFYNFEVDDMDYEVDLDDEQ